MSGGYIYTYRCSFCCSSDLLGGVNWNGVWKRLFSCVGYVQSVCRVSGGCLKGVWKVSGG